MVTERGQAGKSQREVPDDATETSTTPVRAVVVSKRGQHGRDRAEGRRDFEIPLPPRLLAVLPSV